MKKDKVKDRFLIFLFVYFAFFASYYMTDTLTKCIGSLSKGGQLEVAKWDISADSSGSSNLDILPGSSDLSSQTYNLSVTSLSQVGVDYSIVLSNVPTGIEILFDNVDSYYESNNIISIPNAGSFIANDSNSTHNHTITFIAPSNTTPITDNDVNIDINFTQKTLN